MVIIVYCNQYKIEFMDRYQRIISLLTQELHPILLELRDDSARHAGHAGAAPGGQTHFNLVIRSEKFAGLSKVKRHQYIYRLLDQEFKSGLHALSISALTPEE